MSVNRYKYHVYDESYRILIILNEDHALRFFNPELQEAQTIKSHFDETQNLQFDRLQSSNSPSTGFVCSLLVCLFCLKTVDVSNGLDLCPPADPHPGG